MHAVEFSRIGRSPDPTITVRPEGQLLNLTEVIQAVKSTRRYLSELILSPGAYRAEATRLAYPFPDRSQIDSIRIRKLHVRQKYVCDLLRGADLVEVVLRLRGVKLSASPLPCGANK